jgi:hypothetical protein
MYVKPQEAFQILKSKEMYNSQIINKALDSTAKNRSSSNMGFDAVVANEATITTNLIMHMFHKIWIQSHVIYCSNVHNLAQSISLQKETFRKYDEINSMPCNELCSFHYHVIINSLDVISESNGCDHDGTISGSYFNPSQVADSELHVSSLYYPFFRSIQSIIGSHSDVCSLFGFCKQRATKNIPESIQSVIDNKHIPASLNGANDSEDESDDDFDVDKLVEESLQQFLVVKNADDFFAHSENDNDNNIKHHARRKSHIDISGNNDHTIFDDTSTIVHYTDSNSSHSDSKGESMDTHQACTDDLDIPVFPSMCDEDNEDVNINNAPTLQVVNQNATLTCSFCLPIRQSMRRNFIDVLHRLISDFREQVSFSEVYL